MMSKENNKELDDVLFNDLSDILEDRYDWYECDDITHCYGLDDSSFVDAEGDRWNKADEYGDRSFMWEYM